MTTITPRAVPLTDEYLNSLPLHQLLLIGLRDARKQERAPNSVVFMGDWLSYGESGLCRACLAGSVMRWSCGEQRYVEWTAVLDELRRGEIGESLRILGRERSGRNRMSVRPYGWNHKQWWRDMGKLYAYLRREGI